MLNWLLYNWQSLLVGAMLLLAVYAIIRKMIKDKKAGKSVGCSCGCGCKDCALSEHCNSNKTENNEK